MSLFQIVTNYFSGSFKEIKSRNYIVFSSIVREPRPALPAWLGGALAGVALIALAPGLQAATLTVGPAQQFPTIAAAINASKDGDTVNVAAGLYLNDYAEIRTKITLNAVGGMVKMASRGFIPNEKGVLITDTDITINGFEIYGARVTNSDGANGAGIRYQGGKLVVTNCYIHDNQDGLLANPDSNGTVTISNSEFYHNGNSTGPAAGYTHNIYVNNIAKLDIENSYIHGANVGHEIKSRAFTTIVQGSRIVDGLTGTASYSIDMPNGGVGIIANDQIEQGPHSQNPSIIAYGEEGGVLPVSSLTISNTLILNDDASPWVQGVWNTTTVTAALSKLRVFDLTPAQLAVGNAKSNAVTYLTTEPTISAQHPWQQ